MSGCLGPGIPAQGYCYDPFDDPLAIGLNGTELLGFNENSKCSEKSPCEKCRGDCYDDDSCGEGLFCYTRFGFEPVPGCAGQVGHVYFDNHVLSLFLCFEEVVCMAHHHHSLSLHREVMGRVIVLIQLFLKAL